MTATEIVKKHISKGRIFHAYVVTGSDDAGRLEAARLIAEAAVCEGENIPCGVCRNCVKAIKGIHPDITVSERAGEDKELKIDAMRALRAQAMVMPNEASRSVFIIREADLMNDAAQNAMLKIFEEPPSHAVFVLTAENPERLLETVRSRCEIITLPPKDERVESPLADKFWQSVIKRDRISLSAAATELEKEKDRSAIGDFIAAVKRGAVSYYAEGKISGELFDAVTAACADGEKYMVFNMSAAHIAGLFLSAFLA